MQKMLVQILLNFNVTIQTARYFKSEKAKYQKFNKSENQKQMLKSMNCLKKFNPKKLFRQNRYKILNIIWLKSLHLAKKWVLKH